MKYQAAVITVSDKGSVGERVDTSGPAVRAMLEGAGPVRQFFSIKLRYISPTVLFVTILSLINSFKIFREVYLLTGNYPYDSLYLLQHYMNNMFRNLNYQRLSTAALLMAAVMAVVIGLLFLVDNKLGKDVEEE